MKFNHLVMSEETLDNFSISHQIDVIIDFVESYDSVRYKLLSHPHFICYSALGRYDPVLRVYEPISSLLLIEYFVDEDATDKSVITGNSGVYAINKPHLLEWLEGKRRIYAISEILEDL